MQAERSKKNKMKHVTIEFKEEQDQNI